jgi:hypothetical protein
MQVFLVIIEDRHTDVQVEVFAAEASAISRAKAIVAEYDYEPEEPDEAIDGWLFNATLSCEDDCLRVQAADMK